MLLGIVILEIMRFWDLNFWDFDIWDLDFGILRHSQ